jgi:hypothetical protein
MLTVGAIVNFQLIITRHETAYALSQNLVKYSLIEDGRPSG